MTLDSAGLDALIADVEGASNESFRRDWLLLRLRYARSLAAAAPPTGENPDGPMTEALWKYAQNEWGWGADDYEACRDAITAVVAAGRAAATPDPPSDRNVARMFHEAYERLAPEFGYHTREESAVPWERVPARNRDLMTATVGEVRAHLAAASPDERLREWPDEGWSPGIDDPEPPALGDIDTGEGWYQT